MTRVFVNNILFIFRLNIIRQALFALFILTFCRLIWFFSNLFWLPSAEFLDFFKAFFTGIFFDLPILAYFYLPLWIWHLLFPNLSLRFPSVSKILFTLSSAVCLILNGIDTGYSRITAKRTGFELFAMLGDENNKIAPYIKDYILGILGILVLLYLVFRFTPTQGNALYIYRKNKKWLPLVTLPLFAAVFLLCARGGLRLKPLRSIDAGEFTIAGLGPLVSSTPLQLISTLGQKTLPEFVFMKELEAEKWLGIPNAAPTLPADKKNVVLIIVESLGRDYTGFLNGQPFTPFLDSLSKKSINFRFCFANGTRSIEMVPAIFCGLPGLMEDHYINSVYSTNKARNLFPCFKDLGYSTAFYHGGANGTMGFQAFLKHTGLDIYKGINEYPNRTRDDDGHWGIYDEPYLQYVANELDVMPKPFFTSVFTLSSHHPYTVPDKYKNQLPAGKLPIHKSMAYTDLSLKLFFERAAKSDWYKNTVFVITGDHTSYGLHDYFYSQSGHYEIPLLIYTPGMEPQVIDKSISQCDIGPTVIDFLHLPTKWFGLGRSAFDTTYAGYSVHYDAGVWYLVQYPYVIGLDEKGKIRDFSIRFRNERQAKQLPRTGKQYEFMDKTLKAYLQVYSSRIRSNHWY